MFLWLRNLNVNQELKKKKMSRVIRSIGDKFTIKSGKELVIKEETDQCKGCFFYSTNHHDRCLDRFFETGACHKDARPDGIGIIAVKE